MITKTNNSNSFFYGLALLLLLLFSVSGYGQLYVALDGSDDNPGTIDLPLKTITRAIALAGADTTIYIRGGVYEYSSTIRLNKTGQADKHIKIWAYPGEKVIIDFSSQPVSSSSRGIQISHNYWHLKGLEIRKAGDNGIYISSFYNIIEACRVYRCQDTGIQLSGGASYNKIINCDSYENFDVLTNGENADGFAPKLQIGPGNEFYGCRAWLNADDGWDLYEAGNPVLIDGCIAFRNGHNIWGISNFQGDGNGFKVGGNYIAAPHIVTRCVAFDNKQKGFDQNNNTAGITLYNNTSWRNGGRNFSFPTNPTTGQHILKNNISHSTGSTNSISSTSVLSNNSWQGFTVTNADFESLDTNLVHTPRNADSSLQRNPFLRLAAGSSLIDAGIDVGLLFNGAAPDLGAYETDGPLSVRESDAITNSFMLHTNYPNPFNPSTTITFTVGKGELLSLIIYDVLGNIVADVFRGYYEPGLHKIQFDGSGLSSGVYYARLSSGLQSHTIKLLLMK